MPSKEICKRMGDTYICYFITEQGTQQTQQTQQTRGTPRTPSAHISFDEHHDNFNLPSHTKKSVENLIHPIFGSPITKPTVKDLPQEVRNKALMTKASHRYYKNKDKAEVEKMLRKIDAIVDWDLSTPEALVLVDESGNATISFRGTELSNLQDLKTDAKIIGKSITDVLVLGKQLHQKVDINIDADPEIKKAIRLYENVSNQYVVNEINGFSLGGFKAMYLGEKHNIPTTTFDPLIGSWNIKNNKGNHNIWSTTEDVVSVLAKPLTITNPKVNVNFIEPLENLDSPFNPYKTHHIDNFTETDARRPSHSHTLVSKSANLAKTHNELTTHGIAEQSVKNGETFTQFMKKISPQDVSIVDDTLSSRLKMNTAFTTSWLENGGEFTIAEQQHLTSSDPSNYEPSTTPKERQDFIKQHVLDQQQELDSLIEDNVKIQEQLENFTEPKDALLTETFNLKQPLKTAGITLRAGSIGIAGLGATIATEKFITETEKQTGIAVPKQAEQFLAGGAGGAAMSLFTGAAMLPETIAAGSGYVVGSGVGELSQKLTSAVNAPEEVQKHTALITGGMSGGAVAAAIGGLALGTVAAPEILAGAVIGAGISEAVNFFSQFTQNNENNESENNEK